MGVEYPTLPAVDHRLNMTQIALLVECSTRTVSAPATYPAAQALARHGLIEVAKVDETHGPAWRMTELGRQVLAEMSARRAKEGAVGA